MSIDCLQVGTFYKANKAKTNIGRKLRNPLPGGGKVKEKKPNDVHYYLSIPIFQIDQNRFRLPARLAGITFMQGRTIDEMHRLRAEFLQSLPLQK